MACATLTGGLVVGERVRVTGLVQKQHYNGRVASVVGEGSSPGRLTIELDRLETEKLDTLSSKLSLRPENLLTYAARATIRRRSGDRWVVSLDKPKDAPPREAPARTIRNDNLADRPMVTKRVELPEQDQYMECFVIVVKLRPQFHTNDLRMEENGADHLALKAPATKLSEHAGKNIQFTICNEDHMFRTSIAKARKENRFVGAMFYEPAVGDGPYFKRYCVSCWKTTDDARFCSECKIGAYCSAECQLNHYRDHKTECKEHRHIQMLNVMSEFTKMQAAKTKKLADEAKKFKKVAEQNESAKCAHCGRPPMKEEIALAFAMGTHERLGPWYMRDLLPDLMRQLVTASCKLLLCNRCKNVRYCSKECQNKAWGEHKAVCRANIGEGRSMCYVPKKLKPLPHDPGGKLLQMGLQATAIFTEAEKMKESAAKTQQIRKAIKMREEEAASWVAVNDYIGAAKAYQAIAVYFWGMRMLDKMVSNLKRAMQYCDTVCASSREQFHDALALRKLLEHQVSQAKSFGQLQKSSPDAYL